MLFISKLMKSLYFLLFQGPAHLGAGAKSLAPAQASRGQAPPPAHGQILSRQPPLPRPAAKPSIFAHFFTLFAHYLHIIYTFFAHFLHIFCTFISHFFHIVFTFFAHFLWYTTFLAARGVRDTGSRITCDFTLEGLKIHNFTYDYVREV